MHGIPLSVLINKGTVHDLSFIENNIKDCCFIYNNKCHNLILADKGYESKKIRNKFTNYKISFMIPKKKNSNTNYYFNKQIYKKRIRIENSFSKLKAFRRISNRYDSFIKNYNNFLYLACSLLIFRNM